MDQQKIPTLSILAAFALAVMLPGQGCDPAVAVQGAHALWADGRDVAGAGPRYKVHFVDGGMRYTPALGSRVPRNLPVTLTLESIRRGEVVHHDAEGTSPRPWQVDDTAIYRRGDVVERFRLGAAGVELSYVFDRHPVGRGDVVVRLRVETDLATAQRGSQPDGIALRAEGIGGVRIGGVTGIDALDRRAAGDLRFDGEHLELVLPGAFVDAAAYPLVLDPLVSTDFLVGTQGQDEVAADVAWDETHGFYLAVWQVDFSASDTDIHGQRLRASGTPVGGLIGIETGFNVSLRPAVANVNASDRFLVVWQQAISAFGPWDIRGRAVNASNGGVSPFTGIGQSINNETMPDVGGDAGDSDENAVVTYCDGTDLVAVPVRCRPDNSPPILAGQKFTVSNAISNRLAPVISRSRGAGGRHVVVWRRTDTVFANTLNRTATPGLFPSQLGTFDAVAADVDGDGTNFMVAYEIRESGLFQGDIYCQRLTSIGLGMFTTTTPSALDARGGHDARDPAVALLGPKYLVSWSSATGAFLSNDIILASLQKRSCAACGQRVTIAGAPGSYDFGPRIGAQRASGSTGDDCMVVFSSAANAPPYGSEVRGQVFSAFGGGPVVDIGGGCGSAGTIGTNGPFAAGNRNFAWTLSGAGQQNTIALFLLNVPGNAVPCGPCQFLLPLVNVPVPVVQGGASLPVPISCDPGGIGVTLQVQWMVVVNGVSPCAVGPNLSFTNLLDCTIGY